MSSAHQRVLLGNEAIARGIVEAGCHFMASYPGTPSSEILPSVVRFKEEERLDTYVEWSTNEKVAFENALAAAYTGKRTAVCMKQVGLNVATDPLMSSAYIGVVGGFVIISCDDPGPHSSQTEQDSRFHGMFAKIPVLDPSSPQEAKEMVSHAFELSERYQIPVILRPTLRICHARQSISLGPIKKVERRANLERDPDRWSATPQFRFALHKELNEKLDHIREEFNRRDDLNFVQSPRDESTLGIIAGGVSHAIVQDALSEGGMEDLIPLLKISTPFPLPTMIVEGFMARCDHILLLEETEPVIELQIEDKSKVLGRLNGTIPREGELLPQTIKGILADLCHRLSIPWGETPQAGELEKLVVELDLPIRQPSLCAGCGHRAAFYAIRRSFPNAIFPSDIGCYTLGINLNAVDTCHDMGSSLTFASGFYHAHHQDGRDIPIIATIGDSTFYHSGPSGLLNAVYNGSRFVLVILDNEITAMTGMQPTPEHGVTADGHPGRALSLEELVKGCGVKYLKAMSPYDINGFMRELRRAVNYTREPDGGIAVLISRHPCIAYRRGELPFTPVKVDVQHPPPPEMDLPALERGAIPEFLLPRYEDKTPPCQADCPIGIDARGYVALIAEGKFDEALALVREKNPFPGITGRICSRPCEKACRRRDVDQPVAINLLKRFLADRENDGKMDVTPVEETGERVAVVGSGPAGLMAAYELRRRGHSVTILEALPVMGGMLAVGIPEYRLPRRILERELSLVKGMGIEVRLNTPIGPELTLEQLKAEGYRAIFLATGAHLSVPLGIPGEGMPGVVPALEFLKRSALGQEVEVGRRVAVVGGGNAAIDAARTAIRRGAEEVFILYRRSRQEMPAEPEEVEGAEQEGIRIHYLTTPTRVIGTNGRIQAIECLRMELGEPDESGRPRPFPVEGSQFQIEADMLIPAIGEVPDLSFVGDCGLAVSPSATLGVNPATLETTVEGIFAGGDVVTGPRTYIDAMAAGQKAATSIHRYLRGEELVSAGEVEEGEAEVVLVDIEKVEPRARIEFPALAPRRRKRGFREVQLLPPQEKIVQEAERCLHCGECTQCDICLIQCPEVAIIKNDHGYTVDANKCNACRVCAAECPTSTITMPVVGACVACDYCLKFFECPSLVKDEGGRILIDRRTCVDCGLCLEVCSQKAIVRMEERDV
jgi:indolepyruvate ferredoxin oxidoreductase alpha subunit